MSSDVVIRCDGLGKAFQLYVHRNDQLKQILFGRWKTFFRRHWVLRDVTFEVRRGERVGIIGRNGAGKTTLLQMLCDITRPTHGSISIDGRIAPILALGAGFDLNLTGRENALIGGAILGLKRSDILLRLDSIAAFADIGDFFYQPLRIYSSGMAARLAFAICAHADADILIVDEALSVGDAAFAAKCDNYIRDFAHRGTILVVSHDLLILAQMCDRVIWIEDGLIREIGEPEPIIARYKSMVASQAERDTWTGDGVGGILDADCPPWPQPPKDRKRDRWNGSSRRGSSSMTAKKQAPLDVVMQTAVALKALAGSPAFMPDAYAQRYLGTARLKHFSLLHYLTIGEARGCLPNPFFDPVFFQKKAGTRRLVDFLTDQRLWIFATSPYFDTAWYVARHAGDMDTNENPLLHFLSKGFHENYDPSSGFETSFFRKAVGRDEGNKLRLAYEWLSDPLHQLPVSMAALEARQRIFHSEIALNTIRLAPSARRRNLVFVQAGSAYEMAGLVDTRSYDLMLNYYEPRPILPDHADYIFQQAGTKASGVFTLWSRHPELFARYDAVLLLDDDVSITASQIERLFVLQAELGADLLQASLTPQSACFFPVLKQPLAGPGVRNVTAVEIMMPVVSRRAMAKFGWVFGEAISGWGVDLLLSAKVREAFGDTIRLAGEVVCAHEREVDMQHGSFYRFLRARSLDATTEAGRIALKYGVNDKISAINFLSHTPASLPPES